MSLISKEHLSLTLQAIKNLLSKKADKSELEEEISKVSKNIVQSDWNQSDENAADFVKNRTHYVEVREKVILEEVKFSTELIDDRIVWKNNIAHLFNEAIVGDIYNVYFNGELYKIPVKNHYICGKHLGNTSILFNATDSGEPFCISLINASGAGVYTEQPMEATLKITSGEPDIIHQLDEKFIPDTIARVDDFPHDTRVTTEVLPETIFNYNGSMITWTGFHPNYFVLTEGKTYEVIFDDVPYYCVCNNKYGNSYITCIGNKSIINTSDANTGEPFYIQWENYYDGERNYFWFSKNGEHTLAINELISGELKLLDEKFIPSSIVRTKDIDSINNKVNSNETRIITLEDNFSNLAEEVSINTNTKMTYGNTIEIPSEFVDASYQSAVDENGKIVIVNRYGKVIYSVDGIHWDYSEIPVDSLVIHNVIYANNKFFAVGTCITTNHGVIAYSSDAISWTTVTFSDISLVFDVAYGNGKFIATTFSNKIITSTDGISWTSSTVSAPRTDAIAYGNDKFVMASVSNSGTTILYSTDGDNWTSIGLISSELYLRQLRYYDNKFICLHAKELCYSENGVDWITIDIPSSVYSFAYCDDKFLLYGYENSIYYVTDLNNLTQWTKPLDDSNFIAYANGKFITISNASNVATSSIDGICWGYILQNSKDITKEIKGLVLDEYALEKSNTISVPSTASVGQTIVVKTVDENGKPTEWEAVDPWVITSSTEGSTKRFKLTIGDDGVLTATEIVKTT